MTFELRERKEGEIITQYDPINRSMNILDAQGKPFRGQFHQGLITYPVRMVLEIDSRCNFRCQYCSEGINPPKFNISKRKIMWLIDEAEEMKVHELTLRGGEATLHPWAEGYGLKLRQAEIADRHYGYYLGWLKSLDRKPDVDPFIVMSLVRQYDGI